MKRYKVRVNGVMTTLRLSDADAEARGLLPVVEEPAEAADTGEGTDTVEVPVKARTPANKSRRPANKRRGEAAAVAFTAKAD